MPSAPHSPFPAEGIHEDGELIWVPLRGEWVTRVRKPEEVVRQDWVRRLHLEGGYALEQMDQEKRTFHGRNSPRADVIVWASVQDRLDGASPVLVVETKADHGPVRPSDYWQGESYARAAGARFLVLANADTAIVHELTAGIPGRTRQINAWPHASDLADPQRLHHLVNQLEVFDREQFQRVLFECHTLLRDNHAMTPDRAFDTISKVLFIKLRIERAQAHETFSTAYVREAKRFQPDGVHEWFFQQTKDAYADDDLFPKDDVLGISASTFEQIVAKLERFNLSKTGEDIKGIAFERFLGRTFRGELGQFFTPRPVVDFIVDMLDPKEGEVVCDPASGSGGFLIRSFEYVRDAIISDVEAQRDQAIEAISAEYSDDANEAELEERDSRIEDAVQRITEELESTGPNGEERDTRVGRLAWRSIYGTDKEPRAARTAKMNMIMHGDGHGGIHWHDGLIDTHGVFEGRFDVVITNPPFGATVTNGQKVGATPETDVPRERDVKKALLERFGEDWKRAQQRVESARGEAILDQYDIGRGQKSRKTEQLFLERCLRLLKPGGRVGIVLPNGNLNAASQAWLRRWTEGQAFLRAVVALPAETFRFSGASVTASILVLEKFTSEDADAWERAWEDASRVVGPEFDARREKVVQSAIEAVSAGDDAELSRLVDELAKLDVTPTLALSSTPQRGLVRSAARTTVRALGWLGPTSPEATGLKREHAARSKDVPAVAEAMSEVRQLLRELDESETGALWERVRESFDYPVFMATPAAVGITATGETGGNVPNDLPDVLRAWREFRS